MEKTLNKVAWIIFASTIIGALATMVAENHFRYLILMGAAIADVLVIISIFYHSKKA